MIMQSCLDTEVRESERRLSGNENCSPKREGRESVLRGHDGSSLVVDSLCDQARGQNTAVACFYFDFAARKEQPVTSMLGSLLKQVVGGMEKIPEEISQAFQEQKRVIGGRAPRLPDIVKMIQTITSSLPSFVCIDALDECEVVHRVKLLDSLKQILGKSPRTRIFITGRPHIRAEIEKRLAGRATSISLGPSKDDIAEYLRVRLDEDITPDAMEESLEREILEKIPEIMSDMYVGNDTGYYATTPPANGYASRFLLASLNIDAILQESTISRRREKLGRMTNGLELEDVYGATIERIKAQDGDKSRLGMMALMWISHAERPLQADELCHALAVQLGSTDFDFCNIPSMSTLLNCCQGLITVDKEASTVRLIHFTLQEYLSAHSNLFIKPHSAIAEICLTYLSSQQVKALSTTHSPDTRNTPFLEYCSVYWGVHAKRDLSDYGRSLALELLKEDYSQVSTELLLAHAKLYSKGYDTGVPFSGLHCASFFGIAELVVPLIEMGGCGSDEEGYLDRTPLTWATYNGHEKVVEILLGCSEVTPDKPDKYGQTPLGYAARNGHEGIVKILLGREEVTPDKPGNYGRTPLLCAARNGHEGVVKILLGSEEVNPDKADNGGQTPLLCAARNGHEGVVKILLGREDVNPDKADNNGQTPLLHAAWNGQEGVIKILLGREEVNPDTPDKNDETPLSWAAYNGHEGVVKILLGRQEVNPDKPNKWGSTPLSHAAQSGHGGVVKILLGREEVNPNKPNKWGSTPLSWAARHGHEGVTKILLGREEVNPDKANDYGETPLSYATKGRHEKVVALLRSRKVVTPSII